MRYVVRHSSVFLPMLEFNGQLFLDRRPRPFDRVPSTRLSAADRRYVWDRVVTLASLSDPAPER